MIALPRSDRLECAVFVDGLGDRPGYKIIVINNTKNIIRKGFDGVADVYNIFFTNQFADQRVILSLCRYSDRVAINFDLRFPFRFFFL